MSVADAIQELLDEKEPEYPDLGGPVYRCVLNVSAGMLDDDRDRLRDVLGEMALRQLANAHAFYAEA